MQTKTLPRDPGQSYAIVGISHDPSSQQLERGQAVSGGPTPAQPLNKKETTTLDGGAQRKSSQGDDINGMQCKLARTALGWGVRDLAKKANVSQQTITRLEKGERLRAPTLARVIEALETAGIDFIPSNGGGFGIRYRPP